MTSLSFAEIPTVAVGAIVAALIAALASLLSLILSKEQKTSEFRQDWIDSVRSEASNLIARMHVIHVKISNIDIRKEKEFYKENEIDMYEMRRSASMIKMYLNSKEQASQELLAAIEAAQKVAGQAGDQKRNEFFSALEEITSCFAKILKAEWNRVKRGEIAFRLAKLIALLVVIAAVAILFVAIYPKLMLY